jgi:hypothetical protein
MQALMARLGLEVNMTKTRIARLPEESFNFLGYTVGGFYGKDGHRYIGTRPSRKAVRGLLKRIHERTTSRWSRDHHDGSARLKRFLYNPPALNLRTMPASCDRFGSNHDLGVSGYSHVP